MAALIKLGLLVQEIAPANRMAGKCCAVTLEGGEALPCLGWYRPITDCQSSVIGNVLW